MPRPTGLPRHGTRGRYREPYFCRCVACTGRVGITDDDYTPRWPARQLELFVGLDRLRMWADEPTIEAWRAEGLSDVDADHVAIKLGVMPSDIWSGYITAGLDFRAEVTL